MILADKVRQLTRLGRKNALARQAKGIFDTALQTKNILSEHEDFLVGRNERRTSRSIACVNGYVPRSTYRMHIYCANCSLLLCLLFARALAGTEKKKGGHIDEVARLAETLAVG